MVLVLGFACNRAKETTSRGFLIDIATSPKRCGDGRNVVATAIGHHQVKLNQGDAIEIPEVAPRLREIFKYRAERLLYVRAEPGVPFAECIELIDAAWPEVEITSLITPQVEAQARKSYCLSPSCVPCTTLRSFGGWKSQGNQKDGTSVK